MGFPKQAQISITPYNFIQVARKMNFPSQKICHLNIDFCRDQVLHAFRGMRRLGPLENASTAPYFLPKRTDP